MNHKSQLSILYDKRQGEIKNENNHDAELIGEVRLVKEIDFVGRVRLNSLICGWRRSLLV